MAEILVRLAHDEADIEAARKLCWEWYDWHWENYPADWPRKGGADWLTEVKHPLDSDVFREVVDNLPNLHKRPNGGILVAYLDGAPAGVVMYNEAGPAAAEFHRMFVTVAARGHRLGQRLLEAMFEQMVADGYERVFFSSAAFLKHARAMYRNAGFTDMPHPEDFPEAWRDRVYFMERALR